MRTRRERRVQVPLSVRILVCMGLLAMLFFAFSSFLSLREQNGVVREARLAQMEQSFEALQVNADEQFSSLLQLVASVHENEDLRKVALRESSIVDVLHAQSELQKLVAVNPLLNGVKYYVRGKQILFTRDELYEFPQSEPYYLPYRELDAADMRSLFSGEMGGEEMYLFTAHVRSVSVEKVMAAVLPVPYGREYAYATLLVEMRLDKLLKLILPDTLGEGVICRMLRPDGTLLYANSDVQMEQAAADARFTLCRAGEQYYYGQRAERVGQSRLTYEMYVPQKAMDAGLLSSSQMNLLMAVFVLLMISIFVLLYWWTYQPMRLLIEKLSGSEKRRLITDADCALVVQEIEQLRSSNYALLWKLDDNMNAIRASLLRHLLENGRQSEKFLTLCQRAELSFQYAFFRVMLIASQQARDEGEPGGFLHLRMAQADLYGVRLPDMLCVLVNAAEEGAISTHQVMDRLCTEGEVRDPRSLFFARSKWTNDISAVHTHYRRTMERLSRRIFHGARGWNEENEQVVDVVSSPYPVCEIMQLREVVMAWDKASVKQAMLDIQRYLLEEHTPDTVAVQAVSDALQILQKHTDSDMEILLENVSRPGVTAVEVCRILQEGLERVEQMQARQEEDTLTEEMMLYISEMLESPNLSSATVSDHFGMSESAFSHAFKRRTGTTFVKYVTDLKIQRAKSLLICTEQSIEEIASRLNYASSSSFARMFKAETSHTPTQFRKLRDRTEEND